MVRVAPNECCGRGGVSHGSGEDFGGRNVPASPDTLQAETQSRSRDHEVRAWDVARLRRRQTDLDDIILLL